MNTIIIKSMRLTNFKGVRDLSIDFNDTVTNIYGRNGSGKTTVFDAFTWLLFGKDSNNSKQFDLKTLDADGNIIPQIPHEVSAVLVVNGEQITLTRRFTEKWVKRAGKVDREFDGNKEERFFNDVPVSKADYEARIAEICREDIFKLITSPTFFTSQSYQLQKATLHEMAGNVTDEEVAAGNADFEALLDIISGKSLEDFKKEIASKKSHINAELIDLPGHIDEKQRDIAKYEAEDWAAIDTELDEKRKALHSIEQQIFDRTAAQKAKNEEARRVFDEQQRLQKEVFKREQEITNEVMRDFSAAQNKRTELQLEIGRLKTRIAEAQRTANNYIREVQECGELRLRMLDEYASYVKKQKEIQAEQLHIDETQFVCPTCHRPLEVADIEEKEAQMLQNFEEERSKRLARVADAIARNLRAGQDNNARKEDYLKKIEDAKKQIAEYQKRIAEIEASAVYTVKLEQPDASAAIAADARLKELHAEIAKLADSTSAPVEDDDLTELQDGYKMLQAAITELCVAQSHRKKVEEDKQRVAELEQQMQKLNIELAELEKREFVIAEFSKARSAAIEARIDGMFEHVRFRWLKVAINGAESETCEATINGVPYASLNHAGQIIAGLDIINAICKWQNICAPIFIDNAESINDLIPMNSQIVNLIVSRDAQLRVEASNNQ